MKRTLFLNAACGLFLLLTGCAEKWVKPGASEYDFQIVKSACTSRAYARFQPLLRQEQLDNGHVMPVVTKCKGNDHAMTCSTSGGNYVPPTIITIDDNETPRREDLRACYFENGWVPED